MTYYSTKTYGNDRGLSCCFRQWKATDSHCRFLHGYSIGVKIVFESESLDHRNWVMDFGGLKPFKNYLEAVFDHKTIVASDDPQLEYFYSLHNQGLIQMVQLDAVGCEKFSEHLYDWLQSWLEAKKMTAIKVQSVEVFEHGSNSGGVRI